MIGVVLSLLIMDAIVAATGDDNGHDILEYGRRFRTKKRHLRKGTNIISTTAAAAAATDLTEDVAYWTRQLVYSMPPTYTTPAPYYVQVTLTNPPVPPDTNIDFTDPPSGGGGTVEAPDTSEPAILTDPPISSSSTDPPAPSPLSPFPTETEGSFKTQSPTPSSTSFASDPPFIMVTPDPPTTAAIASETLTPTDGAAISSSSPPAPPPIIDEVLENNTIDLSVH